MDSNLLSVWYIHLINLTNRNSFMLPIKQTWHFSYHHIIEFLRKFRFILYDFFLIEVRFGMNQKFDLSWKFSSSKNLGQAFITNLTNLQQKIRKFHYSGKTLFSKKFQIQLWNLIMKILNCYFVDFKVFKQANFVICNSIFYSKFIYI